MLISESFQLAVKDLPTSPTLAENEVKGVVKDVNGITRINGLTPHVVEPVTPELCSPTPTTGASTPTTTSLQTSNRPSYTPHRCYITADHEFPPNWKFVPPVRSNNSKSTGPSPTNSDGRPPFITVVRRGSFLRPPKDISALLGVNLQQARPVALYTFSSQPHVVNNLNRRKRDTSDFPTDKADSNNNTSVNKGRDSRSNARTSSRESQQSQSPNDRDTPASSTYHLMYDRRVVRGPVLTQHSSTTAIPDPNETRHEVRRRALARRKARYPHQRLGSPPAATGRRHIDVQTDKYLEELWEKPPEEEVCCQTDPFVDRPPTPIFVPAKTGLDVQTQIYPGELFDFDVEVVPILEVLVGKTIEQALLEVMEEEELEALKYQQRRFLERRRAELLEQQRLEEEERRLEEEKERRIQQQKEALDEQRELEDRVMASTFAQRYLRDLVPLLLEGLNKDGYAVDPINKEIDEIFMPWLETNVRSELERIFTSRDLLDDLIRQVTDYRQTAFDEQDRQHYENRKATLKQVTDSAYMDAMAKAEEHSRLRVDLAQSLTSDRQAESQSETQPKPASNSPSSSD